MSDIFRKLLSIYVLSCFPFGFEGRIWDLFLIIVYLFALYTNTIIAAEKVHRNLVTTVRKSLSDVLCFTFRLVHILGRRFRDSP